MLTRHLWQLKIVVFLHCCPIHVVLLNSTVACIINIVIINDKSGINNKLQATGVSVEATTISLTAIFLER